MNKYNKETIYTGNLVKYEKGQIIILKEKINLIYEEKSDTFHSLEDTLNYHLDLAFNKNLSDETREKYQKIINEHSYPYKTIASDGEIYIDESSIEVAAYGNRNNIAKK